MNPPFDLRKHGGNVRGIKVVGSKAMPKTLSDPLKEGDLVPCLTQVGPYMAFRGAAIPLCWERMHTQGLGARNTGSRGVARRSGTPIS